MMIMNESMPISLNRFKKEEIQNNQIGNILSFD